MFKDRAVFWGDLFEPFRFDAAQQSLERAIDACCERDLDATEYVSGTITLLNLLAPMKRMLARVRQEDKS
jgi:hypothetical protein